MLQNGLLGLAKIVSHPRWTQWNGIPNLSTSEGQGVYHSLEGNRRTDQVPKSFQTLRAKFDLSDSCTTTLLNTN
jgi:hypothetical protein